MGNKFKLTILASMILASSLIMPMSSILAIEYDSDNYIQVLENSDIYKELVSSEGLDENAVVNFFDHKFKEDEGIILVTGMVKNNDSLGVFGFIDPNTNEVLSLTKMIIDEEQDSDNLLMIEYDQNKNKVSEFTLSEIVTFIEKMSGSADLNDNNPSPMHLPNPIIDPGGPGDWDNDNPVDRNSWWFQFACQFSTKAACSLACIPFAPIKPAAIACGIACSTIPGSIACRP